MPSFTIHIAIANEYYKKNKNEIKNYKNFIDGIISPDLNTNKSITHYGIWDEYNSYINFDMFFKDSKVDILSDFWKGYFLHLVTDHFFYNNYFKQEYITAINEKNNLYNDFYFLNSSLINDYKIEFIEDIKEFMELRKGKCRYLDYKKIKEFINEISNKKIIDYKLMLVK